MTFTVRLTGQHQAVHMAITHTNSAGGLCLVTNGGYCDLFSHNPLHSHSKEEVLISSCDGLAAYQEKWYQDPLELMKNTVQ